MMDNVTALRMCSAVHDHWLGSDDSMKTMTESQKTAENTHLQTISQRDSPETARYTHAEARLSYGKFLTDSPNN